MKIKMSPIHRRGFKCLRHLKDILRDFGLWETFQKSSVHGRLKKHSIDDFHNFFGTQKVLNDFLSIEDLENAYRSLLYIKDLTKIFSLCTSL